MGKPTGFIEYPRELPADRPVEERIRDWQEFHLHFPEEKLRTRCRTCGPALAGDNSEGGRKRWQRGQMAVGQGMIAVTGGVWERD